MKTKKSIFILALIAVITLTSCNNGSTPEQSSIPTFSLSESSDESTQTSSKSNDENKLNEEAEKLIKDNILTLIRTFDASNIDHTLEYYKGSVSPEDEEIYKSDPLSYKDADLIVEKDKDGNVVRIVNSPCFPVDMQSTFLAKKLEVCYIENEKIAYEYKYVMNKDLPVLSILNDISEKDLYEMFDMLDEYNEMINTSDIESDASTSENIEDLDVILLSVDPYFAYKKNELEKSENGYYISDTVRCINLKK